MPGDELSCRGYHPGMSNRESRGTKMLSPVQVDILKHLARGESYKTIATRLRMTTDGIQYHITQLRQLLQLRSLPAIIALAIVAGVLTADQWPVDATGELFIDL